MNPVFAELSKVGTKCLAKFPSWVLGWRYPETRLDSLVWMDISGSGAGVDYYYPNQEASCWINVVNHSVFDFTIDRMKLEVSLQGGSFTCGLDMPKLLKCSSCTRVYLTGKSPVPENAIEHMRKSKKADVQIEALIISPIRSFQVRRHIGELYNLKIN